MSVTPLLNAVLRAEILAARIEAVAAQDPALGSLWRAEAALAEAVASVGMEDVRLRAADLLARVAGHGEDPQAAAAGELALGLLRVLKAPGDILRDPAAVVRRFERIAGGPAEDGAARLSEAELSALVAQVGVVTSPILTALRIAADYALLTERRSPMVERLVFVAAEGALRRVAPEGALRRVAPEGALRRVAPEGALHRVAPARHAADSPDPLRGLGAPVVADWVALPATALTQGRFAIWSPASAAGLRALLEAVGDALSQELGRIGTLRGWSLRAAQMAAGQHGRARLADALAAFMTAPLQSSALLAQRIGMTQRGALNVLATLVDQGLIREVTGRRAARLWATPGIAARLEGVRLGQRMPVPQALPEVSGPDPDRAAARRAALARAFADLDRAMGQADAILEGRAARGDETPRGIGS